MRTLTGFYFESKIRTEKMTEDGTQAKINELYVVNAMTFTECESKVLGYMEQYTQAEFEVLTEAKAKYKEIFFSDKEGEDLFFRVKLDFISLDENTGREKHSKTDYLVQGASVESAQKNVDEVMSGTRVDYKVVSISETAIQDYIE